MLAFAGIVVVVFLTFYPSLFHGFSNLDDPAHLLDNPLVRSLSWFHIKATFTGTVQKTYIPLTVLSYALEHQWFAFNAFIYHLDNVVLHVVVSAFVLLLGLNLGFSLRASLFGALLFGVHPMHVESVVWVTERKDVLYAFFYLAALWSYGKYLNRRGIKFYFLSLFLGMLSILAKPMALSLPLILLLLDWFYQRKMSLNCLFDKLPFFIIVVPITWITYSLHSRVPWDNLHDAALIWVWSLAFYLKQFFVPVVLVPLYQLPMPIQLSQPQYFLALAILVGTAFLLYRFRHNRQVIFAAAYFFLSIFFLLRFDLHDQNIVADRFMYLPSLGICLGLGALGDFGLNRARMQGQDYLRVFWGITIAVFLLLVGKTIAQINIWKNPLTFWNHVVRYSPMKSLSYNNRGFYLESLGRTSEALADYNMAILIRPDHDEAYNNRGNVYSKRKDYQRAIADYTEAIKINPQYANAYNNRGINYQNLGLWDLALQDHNRAIELDPLSAGAYNSRALVYEQLGNIKFALRDYEEALKINPQYSEAYSNRGVLFTRQGKKEQAFADYNRAIATDPMKAESYNNRGVYYLQMDNLDAAIKDFSQAIQLKFDYASAYFNRSLSYARIGKKTQALADAKTVLDLGMALDVGYLKFLQSLTEVKP